MREVGAGNLSAHATPTLGTTCGSGWCSTFEQPEPIDQHELKPRGDRSRFPAFLITCRLAGAVPRAPRSLETPEQQEATGARPLLWSSAAGIMLALTFTCRALLVFLMSESVQTDGTAVGLGFYPLVELLF